MSHILVHDVEAFVAEGLTGNPAGVALLKGPLPDAAMLHVARVMGHSETAFLTPRGDPRDGSYDLRWFTPEVEIPLCGHATLASARILFDNGVDVDVIAFHTKSGPLYAARDGNDIRLDFPQDFGEELAPSRALLDAMGIRSVKSATRSPTGGKILLELGTAEEVRAITPDFARLLALPNGEAGHGVIVTARGSGGSDFVSRFFHPWAGIPEDPVTGSAHCLLATHWSERLGRDALTGVQCSARGGLVRTRLVELGRVHLVGAARTVGKKKIPLPQTG